METEILLGWIEPQDRTNEQQDLHISTMVAMPKFAAPSMGKPPVGTKLLLSDLWKHPKVIDSFGEAFTGVYQLTGSCVGAAGGNTILTTCLVDILRNNENEKVVLPWFWYNYGKSRQYAGMRGQGEGSFGSTFAKSWTQDGSSDSAIPRLHLPKPLSTKDGWVWGKRLEMQWSDGAVSRPEVTQESNLHKGTSTQANNADAVRDFILNGYPCTRASGKFVNPNTARVRGDILVGTYNGRGGHQESWLGYWNHPILGEMFYEMNQWGTKAYGVDPGGGPPGGCWVSANSVNDMCDDRDAEVFAFSQYEGYPAQPDVYDWVNNSPIA